MKFSKFKISGKVWSFSYDYEIRDEHDMPVMITSGNKMSFTQKVEIKDADGMPLYHLKQKWNKLRPTYTLMQDGEKIATITRKWTFKPQIEVRTEDGISDYEITGNLWQNDYRFKSGGQEVAAVSRDIWKLAGVYGVAVAESEDVNFILAIVIAIELMRQAQSSGG